MRWVRKAVPTQPLHGQDLMVGWDGERGYTLNRRGEYEPIGHWASVSNFETWIWGNPYWVEVPVDPDLALPEGL